MHCQSYRVCPTYQQQFSPLAICFPITTDGNKYHDTHFFTTSTQIAAIRKSQNSCVFYGSNNYCTTKKITRNVSEEILKDARYCIYFLYCHALDIILGFYAKRYKQKVLYFVQKELSQDFLNGLVE